MLRTGLSLDTNEARRPVYYSRIAMTLNDPARAYRVAGGCRVILVNLRVIAQRTCIDG